MSDPAQRDPKALRRTALLLLAIILASGILIPLAYRKTLIAQNETGRPPMIGKLRDQFAAQNQAGNKVTTGDLAGKAWLATSFSTAHPEPALPSIEAMRRATEALPPDQRPICVLISVNPADESAEDLAKFAKIHQLDPAQWWLIRDEAAPKFIPGRLKLTAPHAASEDEKSQGFGPLVYDPRIVLIDPKMQLRGYFDSQGSAHNYFDFLALRDKPQRTGELTQILTETLIKSQQDLVKKGPNYVSLLVGITVGVTFLTVLIGKRRIRREETV